MLAPFDPPGSALLSSSSPFGHLSCSARRLPPEPSVSWTRQQVVREDYHNRTSPTSGSYVQLTDPRSDPKFDEVWASHHVSRAAFPVDVPASVTRRVTLRTWTDYTVRAVRQFPNNLFLFPDSSLGCGRSGAAVIRDEPNASGVVVGCYPGTDTQPLFDDAAYDTSCRIIDASLARALRRLDSTTFTDLVLPSMDMCSLSPNTTATQSHLAHRIRQLRDIFTADVVVAMVSPIPPKREMPPWYSSKLFDGDMYPYIKAKLGITIPYDRGRHTLDDFATMCTTRPDDVALLATKYRINSIQALDIFLCKNHALFVDVTTPGPQVRKTKLTELDDVLRRRDTRSAAEQSALESLKAATPASSSWKVSRASSADDFTKLLATRDVDKACDLAQALTTGSRSGDLYLYSEMEGTSADRRFSASPYSMCPVQVLRNNDSFIGVPVATESGDLYNLSHLSRATAQWKTVFDRLQVLAAKPTCSTVHFPHYMFGTVGEHGIDSHSDLFSKLMHKVARFATLAANDGAAVLAVHVRDDSGLTSSVRPYTLYRKPSRSPYDRHVDGTPSDTASALRRIRADPSLTLSLRKLPSFRLLHGEHQMLRTLESCTSFRHIWLADMLESSARVRAASSSVDPAPHGDAWLRKQHPTILAPIHPDGLQRFQAGPIVPVQLNDLGATAMLDSGFTSNFAADYCIVQPEFCTLHNIRVDEASKSRVALADGTVSNTLGTASMKLQVGSRRPETIFMKVMHMPPGSPVNGGEGFDILLGFTWMLNREMSLWHERGADGVITPGLRFPNRSGGGTHTLIPYISHWDRSRSEIQAFTITSLEHNVVNNYWSPVLRHGSGDVDVLISEGAEAPLSHTTENFEEIDECNLPSLSPDLRDRLDAVDRENAHALRNLHRPDDFEISDEDKLTYRDTCTDAYHTRLHDWPGTVGHLCRGVMQATSTTEEYLRRTSDSASQHVAQIRLARRNQRDQAPGYRWQPAERDSGAVIDKLTDTHVDFWTTPDSSGRNLGSLDDESFLKELETSYIRPMDLTGQLAPSAYHAATKTNHLKSPSSGGSITHRATLRRRHRVSEVRRLKEILQRQFDTNSPLDYDDNHTDVCTGDENLDSAVRRWQHGDVWAPEETVQVGDDIMEDIMFIGDDDANINTGMSPVFLDQLRLLQQGDAPDASIVGFEAEQVHVSEYRDIPTIDRIESGLTSAPMAAHVQWAMHQERAEISDPCRRLVTNMMRRNPSFASTASDQVNFIQFVRRVEQGMLPATADRELGSWCKSIAPPEVTDALTATCSKSLAVPAVGQTDGTTKVETMTVDQIAADIVDNTAGRILGKHREIFNDEDSTRQVKTTTPFKATLREDQKGKKPFFEFRRPAPALRSVLERWILDSMKKGVVKPWVSCHSSPVFAIKKPMKPGEVIQRWRTLVDLRACNAALVPHRYPVPSTSEIFASLSPDFKVFSGFDACDGFFQVPVDESTFDFLAFMSMPVKVEEEIVVETTNGKREVIEPNVYSQFTFCVLPQGSQFSPSIFTEELISTIAKGLPEYWNVNVFVFVDDICIGTEDYDTHLVIFRKLAAALYNDGWTLARQKTSFMKESLRFLGLVISSVKVPEDGDNVDDACCKIWGDRAKIEVILNLKEPTTLKELRSVLGALGFYRIFVPSFGITSRCLTNLTKKDADVRGDWTEECSRAFTKLKLDVATAAAVTPFDNTRQVLLQIDSCKEGTAGVLSQPYGNRLRPICFYSKSWTGSEMSASPQLSELKGLVACCMAWKQLLWGAVVGISILSDHGSLKYLASARAQGTCSDRVERFAAFLGSLNATVSWRAGAGLLVADHLSRHGHNNADDDDRNAAQDEALKPVEMTKKELKQRRSGTMRNDDAQAEISKLYPSRYDHTSTGMKSPTELLDGMTTNVDDFGAFTDEEIDKHMVGGQNTILSGFPMNEVLSTGCKDEDVVFHGTPIQQFVRMSGGTFNTGHSDAGSDTIAANRLQVADSSLFYLNDGYIRAINPQRMDESLCDATLRTFKDLWMPGPLDTLRDQMQYDGQEIAIQRVLVEGLPDDEAESLGILHQKDYYGLNNRSELMIYDADIGWATVIPSGREDIFRAMVRWVHEHDHGPFNETFRSIRRRFWWNSLASMRKVIREVCRDCITCSTQKSMRHTTYFQPKPIDVGHMPFQVISIDPKPMQQLSSQGHDSLLCIVDRFSGWTIAIPHMQTDTADDLARILDIHVYTIFGCPRLILSDNDTKFHSAVFQAVQKRRGVTVSLGTPYHGRTSGGIEIRIKALQEHLRIRTDAQGSDWLEELPEALMAVNNTVNDETTLSPQMILMGYRPTSPVDMLREPVEDDKYHLLTAEERLEHYLQHRDDDRRDHRDRLRVDRERQETASQRKSGTPQDYAVGGWVILHRRAFGPQAVFNGRKVNKLERMEAYGPYRVLELQDKGRIRVELRRDWSNQKTNIFTLQDVRWFYNRRPWEFDQISLEQHLAETWSDNREYEVDYVVSRRYNRRTYTYQVKFKGRTGDKSKFLAIDSLELQGCSTLLQEFDAKHPFGSLANDSPPDKVRFNKTQRSTRWSGRLRLVMDTCRDNAAGRLLRRASQLGAKYAVVPKLSFANAVRVSFFEDKVGSGGGTLDDD